MKILIPMILLWVQDADRLNEAGKEITADRLRAYVTELAGDAYEGRAAGFPGSDRAADFIRKEFKSFGLKPGGTEGYYQPFPFKRGRKEYRTQNCLALLEGSDPILKKELVVIGGHYDHVGTTGTKGVRGQGRKNLQEGDDTWNGADDNASGTSCVLSIARAFSKSKLRPKRSILFALWGAEEAGLLGSKYWCANPTWDIVKVVFNLNMDMVGRNPDRPVDLEGLRIAAGDGVYDLATSSCRAEDLEFSPFDFQNEAMFRSDGASFVRQSIPAIMFFASWHADYHNNGDHAEKLAYPRMAKLARAAMRILSGVANFEETPAFNPDTPVRNRYRPLGFGYEVVTGEAKDKIDLPYGGAALRVTSVSKGGACGAAGLRVGDVVVGFNRKPFSGQNAAKSIRGVTSSVRSKRDYDLEIRRDGKPVTLKINWPK